MAARPGEQWNYCTAGYAILGEVIARVSGRSYKQYIKEYITDPLGMEHTFMDVPKPLQKFISFVNEQYTIRDMALNALPIERIIKELYVGA